MGPAIADAVEVEITETVLDQAKSISVLPVSRKSFELDHSGAHDE